jgi:LEA14-like dessication related protein
MSARTLRLALLLALVAAGSGCAFKRPTLRFKSAAVAETDLEGTTLQVVFAFKNPNPLGLDIAEVSYALEVEGHSVISGKPPNGLNLRSNGSTDLVFPARVRFLDLAPVIETFLTKDVAHYKASGTIGIQTPLGILRFPLSYENSFAVPKAPAFAFQSPRVQNLSFAGARVVFPLQMTNRNSFPLPLGGFSANIAISGSQVGTANAAMPTSLGAGETRTVELPLDVNFMRAGVGIANAIRGGSAHVRLDGALRSGASSVPIVLEQNLSFR